MEPLLAGQGRWQEFTHSDFACWAAEVPLAEASESQELDCPHSQAFLEEAQFPACMA